MSKRPGILDLLASGPVIGDGSMIMVLEKRGYVRSGPWTPEAVVTHPDAVRQLLKEYVWAGSDVIQTPTFHSSDRRLELFNAKGKKIDVTADEINEAACKMAIEVADEGNVLVCGGFSPTSAYEEDMGEEAVRREFEVQTRTYKKFDIDFYLGEFFGYIDELEQCVDVMKSLKKPVACTMKIGPPGDYRGVSVEECAVRMAKTGADMIGVNCYFDVNTTLKTMKRIKDALKEEELSPYLMCQPVGWMCPEAENDIKGVHSLPESPFALDPRLMTRYEAYKFARSAHEMGINYIGGCCGCESHHIRAFAQELQEERKRIPPVNVVSPPYTGWVEETEWKPMRVKGKREFWLNVKPGSGRPFNSACTEPMRSDYQKLDK